MATTRGKAKKAEATVVAYKGFSPELQCQGYQFAVGKTFTHDGPVKACSSGFHACEAPFDVWSYYDFGTGNRFCRVHLSGKTDRHEGDSKIAAETVFIETELTLGEMIRAGVKYEIDSAFKDAEVDSGNYATNASSGNYATNEAHGERSTIAAAGLNSLAKGVAGTAIALPYKDAAGQIRFACGVVGEDGIPADTWLIAKDGKLVAA
jgi:hypothetical protein